MPTADATVRSELAPSGKLRAAINLGNPILASRDAASGEARGVSVDLARELGRRLGVPVELVTYTAAGKVVDSAKANEWDIAFVAIDPKRFKAMLGNTAIRRIGTGYGWAEGPAWHANGRFLKRHLDAVHEVIDMISDNLRAAESDGTYTNGIRKPKGQP